MNFEPDDPVCYGSEEEIVVGLLLSELVLVTTLFLKSGLGFDVPLLFKFDPHQPIFFLGLFLIVQKLY